MAASQLIVITPFITHKMFFPDKNTQFSLKLFCVQFRSLTAFKIKSTEKNKKNEKQKRTFESFAKVLQ